MKGQIVNFEQSVCEKKKFKEFAKFLRLYLEAKRLNQNEYYLDAYAVVINALQHFGKLELLERGKRPEEGIWDQLQELNTESYKLYSEICGNTETLQQRIELALLAFDYTAVSKINESCSLLLRILSSRKEPWSLQELMHRSELHDVKEELPLILRKLAYRSVIKQTTGYKVKEVFGQGTFYSV